MTVRTLLVLAVVASLAGFAFCYSVGGVKGLTGFGLGLFSTGFGLAVWWYITGLICHGVQRGAKPMFGSIVIVLAFLCKLPLFLAAANLAIKIGGDARGCFLGGLGLVYCCLVGRSLAHSAEQPN